MQVEEALKLFLAQMDGDGRARTTTQQVARHVRLFAAWLGDVGHGGDVTTIDHAVIARFFGSDRVRLTLDGRPRRPGSANAIRSSLKGWLGYLHAIGVVPRNAGALIRRARCGPALPRAIAEADVARLRAALAGANTDVERRDRCLVEFMLAGGVRVGSATQQLIQDLDLDRGEARVTRAKGNREQRVVLPSPLADLLRSFVGARRAGWLFEGASGGPITTRQAARRLAEWSRRAALSRPAHPHSLRHRYASALYERCGDINLVRVALGHASVASSQPYALLSNTRLRAAIAS